MKKHIVTTLVLCGALVIGLQAEAKKKNSTENKKKDPVGKAIQSIGFRALGPGLTSGRIADIAVHPSNPSIQYVAVASGGVWKTENYGNTYQPIFDKEGSYSIGCVTIDPNNPNVIWVGTGENNNQRSVAYGDGVYKSEDGGATWKHLGLKTSEHIGMISIDPRNSERVFVAAYGPLWNEGGERGVYLTEDGGETWSLILELDEHTGCNEIHIHPSNPEVLFATTHQRRRHVFTYISGGPGSAMYRSTNGGKTWQKVANGFPKGELGRIGMDISPVNTDFVYAIVEGTEANKGVYRSTDMGASWSKMSNKSTSGNYYQEIYCDLFNENTFYVMDTYATYTTNGGKSFIKIPAKYKHVDDHCLWQDPNNKNHFIIGSDGGLYESWDHFAHWDFKSNLPVTQFYKVSTDNALPFYNIYGGTQDNFSFGGPSQTQSSTGIRNSDWIITKRGDGFETQVDPNDPNIVYSQSQYGWLVRYHKNTGEKMIIKPFPKNGEAPYRWNWDAPLLISPHNHKRLYFAANRVFRSDNQGNAWKTISPDLSSGIDRNALEVMGKVWSVDAIAKNKSTSMYGNIVALTESPLKEDLLYAGTDDGNIYITKDAVSWKKLAVPTGVPERTYVNMLYASKHKEGRVYALLNNHKNGDFKPYVYRSEDYGQTWTNLSESLPKRGSTYAIEEDHVNENLLFIGTEFGVFATIDGGNKWYQLKKGVPTIAVRDLAIQERENDLVLGTFGRGFYVLDNYAPLREINNETIDKAAHIFKIEDALVYSEQHELGIKEKGFQGDGLFTANNPAFGATIRYYVKDVPKTQKQVRQQEEKKAEHITYPSFEELRAEDRENKAFFLFEIRNEKGNVIRKLHQPAKKGMQTLVWDLRHTARGSVATQKKYKPAKDNDAGRLTLPGTYTVQMHLVTDDTVQTLSKPVEFQTKWLMTPILTHEGQQKKSDFTQSAAELRATVSTLNLSYNESKQRIETLKSVVKRTPKASPEMFVELVKLEKQLDEIQQVLFGDKSLSTREFETPTSLNDKVGLIMYGLWNNYQQPTETQAMFFAKGIEEVKGVQSQLTNIAASVEDVGNELKEMGAPPFEW